MKWKLKGPCRRIGFLGLVLVWIAVMGALIWRSEKSTALSVAQGIHERILQVVQTNRSDSVDIYSQVVEPDPTFRQWFSQGKIDLYTNGVTVIDFSGAPYFAVQEGRTRYVAFQDGAFQVMAPLKYQDVLRLYRLQVVSIGSEQD